MQRPQELTDLTICRGIFALMVFLYHVNLHVGFAGALGWFAPIITHGYLGVDGFFLLSGLILARVERHMTFTLQGVLRFWGKRLARIYPVHLAVIILLGLLVVGGLALGLAPRDPHRFGLIALVDNLLLIQSWGTLRHLAWNYPAWSISAEWAGYLVFPFILAGLIEISTMVIGTFIPLCFMLLGFVSFLHGGLNQTYLDSLPRFFVEFFAGMTTAFIVPLWADEMPGRGFAAVGAVGAILAVMYLHDALTVFWLGVMLAGFAFEADAERPAIIRGFAPLRRLGILSYAVYMSFAPAELLTSQALRRLGLPVASHGWLYAGMMTAITALLAVALHYLVELPMRRRLTAPLDPARAEALADGSVPV
nr:peptidoglycan/LPS O-acetylase OafA [uncultured Acidiphilium sp.]